MTTMRIFIQVVVVVVQLLPTFVSSMTVQIGAFDTLNEVTAIINDAYRIGESGILMDTPDRPFYRVTAEEVQADDSKEGHSHAINRWTGGWLYQSKCCRQ
jgi:hypothetical protein